jgi:arylsulfatase A-like enzyme
MRIAFAALLGAFTLISSPGILVAQDAPGAPAEDEAKPFKHPNIVIILADDLGWRDLSCSGSKFYETPHIDSLASRGMTFTQAYAASPLCSPTRASILTGLHPARTGITEPSCHLGLERLNSVLYDKFDTKYRAIAAAGATRLKLEYHTLAEELKNSGYATGHFGKWHLGPSPYDALHQGFDVDVPNWYGPGPEGYIAPWHFPPQWNFQGKSGQHIDDRMADEAIEFMRKHKEGPFFVNLWLWSVHGPFEAKPELIKKYSKKAKPESRQRNAVMGAMIESMDDAVGKVVDEINRLGIADNTIILFTSDNGGWSLPVKGIGEVPITDNYPLRGGKGSLYEGGIRVPWFVVWPKKIPAKSSSDEVVVTTDIYPTLLDLAGLPAPKQVKFDGISIVAALRDRPLTREAVFIHFPHYIEAVGQVPGVSVRKGDWKLIRLFADNPDQSDRFELYNLRDDIGETNNLAKGKPEIVKELNQLISNFLKESNATVPVKNPDYVPPQD